jgi:hypothetical protein
MRCPRPYRPDSTDESAPTPRHIAAPSCVWIRTFAREAAAAAVGRTHDTTKTTAAAEFRSLRTANRRTAEARARSCPCSGLALFGVRTTREAVLAHLRQHRAD